ncbi:MAG: endolytic transglycosylase MltG [Betaproteobacteria bacterium]|nr:endolytic transglycosylase MltG [Betaproteobacteria bacterium]
MAAARRWVGRLAFLVVAGCLLSAGLFWFRINLPVMPPGLPLEFSVKQGASLRTVAYGLQEAGALEEPWTFIVLGRVLRQAGNLKAGNYEISEAQSPRQLLAKFTEGDVIKGAITFLEGWTFRQMREVLDTHPRIRHDTAGLPDQELLARIGIAQPSAEGWFFPETYFFATGASDLSILRRAHQLMQRQLASAWSARASDVPLADPYQALILASIVEKETGFPGDRDRIAGVFVNRLRIGMMLQTDPTVIYGLGEKFDGNLRKRDLLSDGPYNTYTRAGLPPTPIAMPGQASLLAAVRPARTTALYFVARGDGSSQFSDNLADHNRAVERYQKNSMQPGR